MTTKDEFLARLAERKLQYAKLPGASHTIHFNGTQTLTVNGTPVYQTSTWGKNGFCFYSPGTYPGCADISISGTTARLAWRGEWAEDFVIGN